MLRIENFSKNYGEKVAVNKLNLTIAPGEIYGFIGHNGAGKSTLLMQTNGLLMPSKGSIDVGGIKLSAQSLSTIRQRVGFIFQDADNQLFMPTVEEDIAFGPSLMPLSASEVASRVDKALQAVGCEHLRHREPHTLSGGEKRRIAIATVLAMTPSILVLDEPTTGLDPKARRELINLLHDFSHTILIATHDMELIAELCPRTLILNQGAIVADSSTEEVFSDLALLEKCGLEQPLSMRFRQ